MFARATKRLLLVLTAIAAILPPGPRAYAQAQASDVLFTISPNVTSALDVVTLTATVIGQDDPVTSGTVVFCINVSTFCDGAAIAGSAQVTAAGTAVFRFRPGISPNGSDAITARYLPTTSTLEGISQVKPLSVMGNSNYFSSTAIAVSGSVGNYTLTGTVTGFGRSSANGSVSFIDTTNADAEIASAVLDGNTQTKVYVPSLDSPISSSNAVEYVTAGDFNNDGTPDLAWVSKSSTTVYVALGRGDGTFQSPVGYSVSRPPAMLAVADVNHDGKLDLLVPNTEGSNTVNVLLGRGDGTFQSSTTFTSGTEPAFITVGDFNQDGLLDLAVVNAGDSTVSILLGTGNGAFGPPTPYSVASSPLGLAMADFNGDGFLDLAVSDSTGVSILRGKGDGTFQAATTVPLPAGASGRFLATGDLRRNSTFDLVVPDGNNPRVYVLLGNGNGTFQSAVAYTVGGIPNSVSLGGINGDGKLDLAAVSPAGNLVSVLLANGDGTFQTKTDLTVGKAPSNVVLEDLNGDGVLDLADSDSGDSTVTVLLQAIRLIATATGVAVPGTGAQAVAVSYPGDGNLLPSASTAVRLAAPGTATTTALAASPNPSLLGQSVTLTATISPTPTGAPLGSVDFFDGATLLATVNITSSGIASMTTRSLPSGTDLLTAVYSGNTQFDPSTSSDASQVVIPPADTALVLLAAPNPAASGQSVQFTATVSPTPTGSPLGSVNFSHGTTVLGSATISATGVATFATSTLSDGVTPITALYSGNAAFASANETVLQRVNATTTTTTTLALSAGDVTAGAATTLTATVTAGGSPVTPGTVVFCNANAPACAGLAVLGAAQLTTGGTAEWHQMFGEGTYNIKAVFAGRNDLLASSSVEHELRVDGGGLYPSATSISMSGSTGNFSLAGTVAASGTAPVSGIVSFLDTNNSNAIIATATLNGANPLFALIQAAGSPISGGGNSEDAATGDFNGDGILDFAVVNSGGVSTVSIHLGNGDGTFQSPVTYAIKTDGVSIAVGDFNRDGKLDLVVSHAFNGGQNEISVLLGNGDGTFQNFTAYNAGSVPIGLAVGDFNHDGNLDIAVANVGGEGGASVSVLLGNGDGTFQTAVQYPDKNAPIYLVAGDFNGDGVLDLAVADLDGGVSVFPGNGDGTFQTRVIYPTSGAATYVRTVDLNKDGKLDLIVSNFTGDSIGVLLGNGDGTFQPEQTYDAGSGPEELALGDFNHDGKVDVAATDIVGNTIDVIYGNSDGTFQAPVSYGSVGGSPLGIVAGDFNGDGLMDVVATNAGSSTTEVLLNQQSASATANNVAVYGAGTHHVLASYPGDGIRVPSESSTVPLAGTPLTGTTVSLALSPNPSSFGQSVTLVATVSPAPTGASLGQVNFFSSATLVGNAPINSSGIATLSTVALPAGLIHITAVYSGNTTFAGSTSAAVLDRVNASVVSTTTMTLSSGTVSEGIATTLTATVTASGLPVTVGTVIFCDASAASCANAAIFGKAQLQSNGTAVLKRVFAAGTYGIQAVFAARSDLLGSSSPVQSLTVSGSGSYPTVTTIASSGSVGNYSLSSTVTAFGLAPLGGTISYLDTSSANEVVATASLSGSTPAYAFTPAAGSPLAGGNGPENVVTADLNGDGIVDLAVVNQGIAGVSIFLGKGDGTFEAPVTYPIAAPGSDIAAGDFNRDGKLDLVTANNGGGTVSLLLGNGDGTFQAAQTIYNGATPIAVAVADFNNDGKLDVAIADIDARAIVVMSGNGDGTFGASVTCRDYAGAYFLAIGDFNGDGAPDIAVADVASPVSIFINNGDGTFQPQAAYSAGPGSAPHYIVTVDLNNDGKLDLVVANFNSNRISVFLGSGDGTFQAATQYDAGDGTNGTGPNGLALGDFNNDGRVDVAVANQNDATVSVLYGNSNGTFETALIYNLVGSAPWGIAAADFNGDGLTDLAVTNNVDSTVSVLLDQQSKNTSVLGVSVFRAGVHPVLASYPGDASRAASQSSTVPLTGVAPTATTTALTASPNPSESGQVVTLTATITPMPTGTALGTVTFFDGTTTLGTANLAVNNSTATATFDTTTLSVSTHTLTASYSGNRGFTTSASNPDSLVVGPATGTATTTALTIAPNPAVFGQSITFTATVSPSPAGSPIGIVTFLSGGIPIGTATPNASGVAAFSTTTNLAVGSYSVTANYGGNAGFKPSTSSPAINFTLNLAVSTTALTVSPSPATSGQAVSLTATVSPTPTGTTLGTVSFFNGANLIGTASVIVSNATATATFDTTALTVGTHALTARYSGNPELTTSTSSPVSLTVKTATGTVTTTALTVAPNPAVFAQSATFTATVSPSPTGSPIGTVTFLSGGTPIGTATPNTSGVATFTTTNLAAGSYSVTANYSGNAGFEPSTSSPAISFTLNFAANTTALTVSPSPATSGQAVTLTATVTPTPTGTALGTVSFFNGVTPLGAANVIVSNATATATFDTTTLAVGTHSLTAMYSGNPGLTTSTSSPVSLVVNTATGTVTTTALMIVPNPAVFGQSTTFTATILPSPTRSPIGTVTFLSGGAPIGTATPNASGVATFTTTTLAAGSYSVTANYGGNPGFQPSTSSPAISFTVNLAPNTTALTASPNPAASGQAVFLTATVTPMPTGTTLGTVSFFDGADPFGTANLIVSNATATATFSTTGLAVGTHALTALYSGNVAFAGSASMAIAVQVNSTNQTATVTAITSSDLAPTYGQSVTLTATVTPAPSGVPPGTVSFYAGTTLLGAQALNAHGAGTLSLSLPLGPNAITAVYSGNANFMASASSALSVSARALSAITFAASPTTQLVTMSVVFTARVNSAATGLQTGTVSFLNGPTVLATVPIVPGQPVVYSATSLSSGTYSVTASYSGDGSFQPSTSTGAPNSITVSDLNLALGGDTNKTVVPGGAVTYNFPLSPVVTSTFIYDVALTATGLPPGATYVFSPSTIPAGSGTLPVAFTVQTAKTTAILHRGPASSRGAWFALVFGFLLPLAGAKRCRVRLTTMPRMLLLLLFGALSLGLAAGLGGCGAGGFLGSPPGQTHFTITVNATSGTLVRTSTVQLNLE